MENDTVLKVKNLSKKFCRTLKRSLFYGTIDITRSMFGINYDTGTLRKAEFWALDNVSFDLKRGETLGIIGVNGSGKSTLLRLITGIFPPDKGCITYRGRIGALIAVGAGFHPHMTGKENIYLNGTILGMSKKEIDSKLEEIVEFADIGDFLEAPVSTYSSGMTVRLGFSIAVHCEPDILLIDEVLAVGDLGFRNKSMRKMNEFREKANALIFISHNLEQIRVLCNRVIVMGHGRVVFEGNAHEAIIFYEELSREKRLSEINKRILIKEKSGENIVVNKLGILDINQQYVDYISMSDKLKIYCDFRINNFNYTLLSFSVGILDETNRNCIWVVSNDNNKLMKVVNNGEYRLLLTIPEHHLMPGVYTINIAIRNNKTDEMYGKYFLHTGFKVVSDQNVIERGFISVSEKWDIIKLGD